MSTNSAINGLLRKSERNPRYFTDDGGKAIYLTGSHVWSSLKDMGTDDPPEPFDFDEYLEFLEAHDHNFIRMWTWEFPKYTYDGNPAYTEPHPWKRTGPGRAADGKLKFDLRRFNPEYFDRLHDRVAAAGERGIYVSVMLFEGHGLHASLEPWCRDGHPFHRENNVNGLDGDPEKTGRVLATHTLDMPDVLDYQERYVRHLVDMVNDLDNVLYEIANESGAYSTEWQYHMIQLIKDYEATKSKQHPVGMTFQFSGVAKGTNQALFDSPADWISPNPDGGYRSDPPAADGQKVILSDTDHLWGLGCEQGWVWKTFTRGMNPLLMDPYQPFPGISEHPQWGAINSPDNPFWEPFRVEMGQTRRYADRMNLVEMVPSGDLASSGYCLANVGQEYLVYLPDGGKVEVDLSDVNGQTDVEWFSPPEDQTQEAAPVPGGEKVVLESPFDGEAVVYLKAETGKA
jgi:hypothetical protein